MKDIANTPQYKSGFVAIVGKPNAGKSTLMNALMGQPIAGISAKPQTTRKRQLGILTSERAQIVFVDTPGLHESKDKLSLAINNEAKAAIEDADLILYLADATIPPAKMDENLADLIQALNPQARVILAMNKMDLAQSKQREQNVRDYRTLFKTENEPLVLNLSARCGTGLAELLKTIEQALPEGPQYYDEEQITEDFERDIASEMIRAAAMGKLDDEVPYSLAVLVNEYSERDAGNVYINATIFVEREAQKGIVIGKGGAMIKQIGSEARRAIEEMSGMKVFLDLNVKAKKDWKDDERFLKQIGLSEKR